MLKMSKRDISAAKREKIVTLKHEGYTNSSIAEYVNVHRNTVSRVLSKANAKSTNEQELLALITNLIRGKNDGSTITKTI